LNCPITYTVGTSNDSSTLPDGFDLSILTSSNGLLQVYPTDTSEATTHEFYIYASDPFNNSITVGPLSLTLNLIDTDISSLINQSPFLSNSSIIINQEDTDSHIYIIPSLEIEDANKNYNGSVTYEVSLSDEIIGQVVREDD
jgi:hypothetical protein